MSREIKFRAWDGQYMVNVVDLTFYEFSYRINDEAESHYEKWQLMQYTGLKDKNGKEIYEGDVVELYNQTYGNITGTIEWEQQACQYWIKWIQVGKERNINRYEPLQAFYGDTEQYVDTRVEVISNIYENPSPVKRG